LLNGTGWNDSISVNGGPPSVDLAYFLNVSPGFLETMKIPLVGGREFRDDDTYGNSAIVNQTFARRFLNSENSVGRSFEKASDDGKRERMLIVGVMRDAYYRSIREPMLPVVFVPFHQRGAKGEMLTASEETFIVRTASANPLALAAMLRQEVSKVRSEFHVSNVRTQLELNQAQTVRERLLATLAFFFGAVALLLAGVGLYGVLNYSVLQREREIGIRMALGAQVGDVVRRITTGISVAVMTGAAAGLALGLASVRYIESLLYQVKATDGGVLAVPCLTILLAVLIAAVPAVLRALRVDPVAILRVE
jgi:ABC-type antimicrobial peptide transport system permease subunit